MAEGRTRATSWRCGQKGQFGEQRGDPQSKCRVCRSDGSEGIFVPPRGDPSSILQVSVGHSARRILDGVRIPVSLSDTIGREWQPSNRQGHRIELEKLKSVPSYDLSTVEVLAQNVCWLPGSQWFPGSQWLPGSQWFPSIIRESWGPLEPGVAIQRRRRAFSGLRLPVLSRGRGFHDEITAHKTPVTPCQ